ncbi:MAG: hypothetical protein PUB33_05200, partial [Ligilactobacillus ruminis]|nr:hypothetical protein [Ligilactobacillus ruminis]
VGPGFDPLTTHQRFGKDIGTSDVFFFVLTEKCRAANENRCKNTGRFQKASFSRLIASNALI